MKDHQRPTGSFKILTHKDKSSQITYQPVLHLVKIINLVLIQMECHLRVKDLVIFSQQLLILHSFHKWHQNNLTNNTTSNNININCYKCNKFKIIKYKTNLCIIKCNKILIIIISLCNNNRINKSHTFNQIKLISLPKFRLIRLQFNPLYQISNCFNSSKITNY